MINNKYVCIKKHDMVDYLKIGDIYEVFTIETKLPIELEGIIPKIIIYNARSLKYNFSLNLNENEFFKFFESLTKNRLRKLNNLLNI